ncbi:MAG: MGMT family protein [Chloroflexi bacterium]|nr:MGMT family protein [Chloroflexota bacterium]
MQFIPPPNEQAYYEQVWKLVRQIPYGMVATYGQIAQMIPAPVGVDLEEYKIFSPRWVGNGMAACPDNVPWQRVINSQGKISQRPGAEKQKQLLEEEGVLFVKDKVNLKVYQWRGPGQKEQPRQARLF